MKLQDKIELDKLEPSNIILGYEVGMDFVGPYYKTTRYNSWTSAVSQRFSRPNVHQYNG
jgi:hypothetical protein